MELVNEFRVPVPVPTAWGLLTDLERIAPCMPGAELLSVIDGEYHGAVRVKVGPITARYQGKAVFQVLDEAARTAVVRAEGRETRGQGNARATVTVRLTPDGDQATAVHVVTDLTISGKAAQFGRGVLAEVSSRLITQFVRNLEADVLSAGPDAAGSSAPAATPAAPAQPVAAAAASAPPAPAEPPMPTEPAATAEAPATPVSARAAEQPVNLLGVVAGPLAKRAAPVLVALIILVYVIIRLTI